jgi:hypothetical protein
MRFYRGESGWETAADRAGANAELVEIDPSKSGLLAFLNARLPPLPPVEPPLFETNGQPHAQASHCPNCGLNRTQAQRKATAYFDSLTVQTIVDKVMELDGSQLGNVLHAGADRLRELEQRAERLNHG